MSRRYWPGVARSTRSAFVRLGPFLAVAVLVRAIFLGAEDILSPGLIAALSGAFLAACFAYGLVRNLGVGSVWNPLAWTTAGAVGIDALMLLVFLTVPLDPFGGDHILMADPLFWLFWTVCGALAGFSYWRIAEGTS